MAHRDLASHNILIGVTGKPWLIDFETADPDAQLGHLWQLASRALVEWHSESTRIRLHFAHIRSDSPPFDR